ncbi:MAG: hypothetical protein GY920_21105 [Aliivibrio sp.]|nr:hypothetical protein [Aliivibrio sp.]MCP4323339.1 hypothetical protein [Alteromonadales bacterium]
MSETNSNESDLNKLLCCDYESLTDIVTEWESKGATPAKGDIYHNREIDVMAIRYYDKIKVFHNRLLNGEWAACFEHTSYIYKDT